MVLKLNEKYVAFHIRAFPASKIFLTQLLSHFFSHLRMTDWADDSIDLGSPAASTEGSNSSSLFFRASFRRSSATKSDREGRPDDQDLLQMARKRDDEQEGARQSDAYFCSRAG